MPSKFIILVCRDFFLRFNRFQDIFWFVLIVLLAMACEHPSPSLAWNFVKVDSVNPVLTAGPGAFICPVRKENVLWQAKDVFNPAAVVYQNKIHLLYRAEDSVGRFNGTSRIGLAVSDDGLHFKREPKPVFLPEEDSMFRYEWEGGVEDPRIVGTENGDFIMTYTAYDGKTARLCIAFSSDLRNWHKAGTVLKGKFLNTWSKSGAIVAEQRGSTFVAKKLPFPKKLSGKSSHKSFYWMYFGDTDLFLAYSEDLFNWTPLEDSGKFFSVMRPRPGMFDSRLVESGPFALWREDGIHLIYNGMNLDSGGDANLPPGAYCTGSVIFDPFNPTQILIRSEKFLLRPDKEYEINGQVNQVCFAEGLVYFKKKWFLYYGTADSKIAVAVSENLNQNN